MTSFDDIVRIYRIDRLELTAWIDQRWVRPQRTPDGLQFDKVDEARIALIRELREDLMVEDDALDVVLALLDQLYATRQILRTVEDAIEACPDTVQKEIRARLERAPQRQPR